MYNSSNSFSFLWNSSLFYKPIINGHSRRAATTTTAAGGGGTIMIVVIAGQDA